MRVFWHVAGIEARKRMSYRADFWIGALAGLAAQIGLAVFIVLAIFRESGRETIGGFTLRGMVLYYVAVSLIGRIVRSTEMEQGISQDIYEGGLTRHLLYPASYLPFKYAQQVGSLLPTLLQVLIAGAWVPFVFDAPVTLASVAMGLASIAAANALYFLLTAQIQALAFWADNAWSLTVAHRILAGLLGGSMIPLALFPAWAQSALRFTPFPYLFAFPVDALFGRVPASEWALGMAATLGWSAALILAGRVLWRRGALQYTGVGI